MLTLMIFILSILSYFELLHAESAGNAQATLQVEQSTFNWSSIAPSEQLQWHNCFERQECARLIAPMNYKDSSNNDTLVLAVMRDPVSISRSDPAYGGSIFLNPGGPGGSGVDYLRWVGYEIGSKIRGPKHFDLISWDPRGVGATIPKPQCFDNDLDRQLFWRRSESLFTIDESEYALEFDMAAAQAFGDACDSPIMRYMTTYLVAQDIITIADALQPDVKHPLINFWGASYGTYLGNVLATAFPNRIGKFVLDGVVGSDDYRSAAWDSGLINASDVYSHFLDVCHSVGPAKCPLHEISPVLIGDKVDEFLHNMSIRPIPFTTSSPHRADLITLSAIRARIFSFLYLPARQFPVLARFLHDLMQTPPDTSFAQSLFPPLTVSTPAPVYIKPSNDSLDNPYPALSSEDINDSERIIVCTDGDPISNWTSADMQKHIDSLQGYFPIGAGFWAQTTTTCTGWPVSKRAPEYARFSTPFGSNLSDYNVARGAQPILFIGNAADPVTPLRAARQESAKHEGSVVLQTDMYGHTSVPWHKSECVWEVIKEYWQEGTLPDAGMVCKEDPWEWPDVDRISIQDFENIINGRSRL